MYTEIRFTLNGEQKLYQGDPLRRLLDVLREDYGLTGSKEGCGEGECGACSIIKNGELVTSCILPVGAVNGCELLTIEGIRDTEKGKCIIDAYAEGGAVQAYKQLFNLTSCVESFAALGVDVGTMDDRIPLDRTVLAQEVEAARATRSTQSTADEADKATYTPGYILRHPVDTVLLFVRSAVENGDHYIRTLVGGSLSYYTVDLAWGWVAVLYLLLAYAALPVQGAVMKPAGKARGWCCAAAALCCLLAVAGCLLWTPTHYDTLYGLQGRYFLPVLPLLLLTCLPRRLAAVPDEDTAQTRLVAALALVQAGMVVNIMLAIIAR